ncbi:hypothetical protein WJX84_009425 [Apatococcus fuscideae]|uniref:Bromo domain-containing protein n=1 Tax=Apatococcus fuscideae TaxID=2026836 RepID=A0AAW1T6R2_9CHLO
MAQHGQQVQPEDLHYLILNYLQAGPCQAAASLLEQEAIQHKLLPRRTDIYGTQHALNLLELQQRYAHVPPTALEQLLQQLLALRREAAGSFVFPGSSSLLDPGAIRGETEPEAPGTAPMLAQGQATAACTHPQMGAGPSTMGAEFSPRELGMACSSGCRLLPAQELAGRLQHAKTSRGHRAAVYCIAFDRIGSLVVTGSDDRLVKIWSTETGLLRQTCRGHDGEVTDLAVSLDNSMVASSCTDHTIRCWSLKAGQMGYPVSVLVGHEGPVTFVDFSRVHACVLLSSSYDGTCRIWDATSPASPPHVLPASTVFGPSRGITRFGGAAAFGQGLDAAETSNAENFENEATASSLLVCSFSPDGTYIAAGSSDSHVYIWHWEAAGPVMMLQFSHDGQALATGSKDGCVQVWRQPRRAGKRLQTWTRALDLKCTLAEDSEVVKLAKRRRRPLDPPTINQIAWSTIDTQVLAAVSDHTIRVWSAATGVLERKLMGHSASVHILEAHPSHPGLMLSASYDGLISVWNLQSGQTVTSFSTKATKPDGTSWVDAIQVADGHWAPDGQGIAVSDVAGQWHLFGLPGATNFIQAACYDQFFSSDYGRLRRDANHYVVDDLTQQPPHLRSSEDRLVDYLDEPYPELYQNAVLAGRLSALDGLAVAAAQGRNLSGAPGLPSGLMQYPPYIAAAAWEAQEQQGDEAAVALAVQRAHQRAQAAELAVPAGLPGPQPRSAAQHLPRASQASGSRGRSRLSQGRHTTPQQEAGPSQPSRPSSAAGRASEPGPSRPSTRLHARVLPSEDDTNGSAGSSDEEFSLESEGEDGVGMSRPQRASQRSMRAAQRILQRGPEDLSEREARRLQREVRQQGSARGGHRQGGRKRPRTANLNDRDSSPGLGSDGTDQEGSEMDVDGRRLCQRTRFGNEAAREPRPLRASAAPSRGGLSSRPTEAFEWLQEGFLADGAWLPQLGDQVVYIAEGHRKLLEQLNSDADRPWDSISADVNEEEMGGSKHRMRPAEPASVVGVDYVIAADRETWMRLRLALADDSSPLAGREFMVDLPPPQTDYGDFVILRSRWDAAMQQCWRVNDRCQVLYEEEGVWTMWAGRIVADRANEEPGSLEDQDASPWTSTCLWERFTIAWDDQDASDEQGHHSPWELFSPGVEVGQAADEAPHLGSSTCDRVANVVESLMRLPRFQAYAELPDPAQKWVAEGLGSQRVFYSSIIPLPLSLEHILARLRGAYYRQPAALLQDLDTLVSNATLFNGSLSMLTKEAEALALRIRRALDGQDAPSDADGRSGPSLRTRSRPALPAPEDSEAPAHEPGTHALSPPPSSPAARAGARPGLHGEGPFSTSEAARAAGEGAETDTHRGPGGIQDTINGSYEAEQAHGATSKEDQEAAEDGADMAGEPWRDLGMEVTSGHAGEAPAMHHHMRRKGKHRPVKGLHSSEPAADSGKGRHRKKARLAGPSSGSQHTSAALESSHLRTNHSTVAGPGQSLAAAPPELDVADRPSGCDIQDGPLPGHCQGHEQVARPELNDGGVAGPSGLLSSSANAARVLTQDDGPTNGRRLPCEASAHLLEDSGSGGAAPAQVQKSLKIKIKLGRGGSGPAPASVPSAAVASDPRPPDAPGPADLMEVQAVKPDSGTRQQRGSPDDKGVPAGTHAERARRGGPKGPNARCSKRNSRESDRQPDADLPGSQHDDQRVCGSGPNSRGPPSQHADLGHGMDDALAKKSLATGGLEPQANPRRPTRRSSREQAVQQCTGADAAIPTGLANEDRPQPRVPPFRNGRKDGSAHAESPMGTPSPEIQAVRRQTRASRQSVEPTSAPGSPRRGTKRSRDQQSTTPVRVTRGSSRGR